MSKININEISEEIYDKNNIEADKEVFLSQQEYFKYLLGESIATKALEFFDIFVEDNIIDISNNTLESINKAIEIIDKYLEDIEAEDFPKDSIAEPYNLYTKDYRGADDGTFDYAGTYVATILGVIRDYLKK